MTTRKAPTALASGPRRETKILSGSGNWVGITRSRQMCAPSGLKSHREFSAGKTANAAWMAARQLV